MVMLLKDLLGYDVWSRRKLNMPNQALAPPYTPGFGRRPPVVAGRDALVDDVARVLDTDAEHPRFCRAPLMGVWDQEIPVEKLLK